MSPLVATLFCLFLCTSAFSQDSEPDVIEKIANDCAKETNTSSEEYSDHEFLLRPLPPHLQCMGKCLLEKLEVIGDDGVIDKEMLSDASEELPDKLRSKIMECGRVLQVVQTCEDMEKWRLCILPAVKKLIEM